MPGTLLFLLAACQGEPEAAPPDDTEPADTLTADTDRVEALLPALRLNEVQASNDSTVMAAPGQFPDWFELFLDGGDPLDLARVTVAVGADTWTGTGTLSPGEHLRIWADPDLGDAPFRLGRAGDTLTLALDGATIDEITWTDLPADRSLARIPDGRAWQTTSRPTPGYTNGSRAVEAPPDDALFPESGSLAFHLRLPAASLDALRADPYTEVAASFGFDAAWFPNVHARLKGRAGSYRNIDQKAGFKIDLNDIDGHALRGRETLTVNNMVQDASYVHEALTYTLFRAMDVPAPRVTPVVLNVNDEPWGLYLHVETVDEHLLARWFPDPTGSMWEGAYGVDLNPWQIGEFEHDQGDDDRTPLAELAALLDQPATGPNLAEVARRVDMDRFLAMMAVEALTLHWDGYSTSNNYRIYLNPDDGRLVFLPWGADQTWVDRWMGPYDGRGRLFTWCMSAAACRSRYDDALRRTARTANVLDLNTRMDALIGTIDPLLPFDVRAEHSPESRAWSRQATRDTIRDYPAWILANTP